MGDDFFWNEYDTEAEASAALAALVANHTVADPYFESITSDWWCPYCPEGGTCTKYYIRTGLELGAGVAFDPATGKWKLYIEVTKAAVVHPCCTACPV